MYERHRHRYEVNNHLRRRLEAAGLVCSGTSPDERLVEAIELPRDEHPFFVASQYHPEFKSRPERPAPLFREFVGAALEHAGPARRSRRRRRRRSAARRVAAASARRSDAVRRATDAERERLHETFAALCRIESPSGRRARLRRLGHARSCAAWASRSTRTTPAPRVGSNAGNLLARIPGAGAGTHPAVRAHGHGPADRAGRAGARRRRLGERERRDPRRRQQVRGGGASSSSRGGSTGGPSRPPVGLELLFTICEEIALRGSREFDVGRLQQSVRLRVRPRHADRRDRASRPRPTTGSTPSSAAAPRTPGVRPEVGRSAIAAAARAIAAMRLGRLDAETTANVGTIEGGTAINVIPERCRIVAEVRSLDRERAEAVVTEMIDHLQDAADGAECDLDVTVQRDVRRATGCGLARSRSRSPSGRCARAATSPRTSSPAARPTRTRCASAGFPCMSLADGTEHNHEPTERISIDALEGLLELALAIVDEAGGALPSARRRAMSSAAELLGAEVSGGRGHPRRGRALPSRRRQRGHARQGVAPGAVGIIAARRRARLADAPAA